MKKTWVLVGAALLVGAAGNVRAESTLKIGLVDMQQALHGTERGKKAKTELESIFNKKKAELQKEEAEIKKMGEEFQKQALALNDKAKAEKQQSLQMRFMKFQETTQRSQQEIQGKERDLTSPILDKIRTKIKEIAKKKNFSVVLEKSDNNVLFSLDQDDLTTEVIQAVNADKS